MELLPTEFPSDTQDQWLLVRAAVDKNRLDRRDLRPNLGQGVQTEYGPMLTGLKGTENEEKSDLSVY